MPSSSSLPVGEQPLRAVVGAVATSSGAKPIVVVTTDESALQTDDPRLAALLPSSAIAALASDARAFRAAYRQELFRSASQVGALVAAHRERALVVFLPATPLGAATASVLDEFFAAWAPC